MLALCAYLTFDGNCREAMEFYQNCFGGELVFKTVGDNLESKMMSGKIKDVILQATLRSNAIMVVASDLVPEKGLIKGNSVSLLLKCVSEEELHKLHQRLSGKSGFSGKPERNQSGQLLAEVTDRYGTPWLLYVGK